MRVAKSAVPPVAAIVAVGCLFALPAAAGPVEVTPVTSHSTLTMTTGDFQGFHVFPKKPCRIDLVGPGELTVTVRLNHARKRAVYRGRVVIRRGKKIVKRAALKLKRSEPGAYQEDESIHPSSPRAFRIKVPRGAQTYSFALRAKRGISMTLRIEYDTEADQIAAREEDDDLDMLSLVPLTPIVQPEKTPVASAAEPEPAPRTEAESKPVEKPAAEPAAKEPAFESVAAAPLPIAKEPPAVERPAPAPADPVVSVGLKVGQISPVQDIGGTTFTGGLDLRYVLPVFDGRSTAGVEIGFHQYKLTVTGYNLETVLTVVPIAVQLFYRIPLGTVLEPFVGVGFDLFVVFSEAAYSSASNQAASATSIGVGGHVNVGAEARLGPGYILAEARMGLSSMDLDVMKNVNVSGFSTVVGYRFVF